MATINNTIYPPILPTYQKAFIKQDKSNKVLFNIQFDVSEYTTITDIQTIEVKIETLNGNTSILAGNNYFVSAKDVIDTLTRTGSIDILTSDIDIDINGNIDLTVGNFYVIQLRMTEEKYTGKNGNTDEAKADQQAFASTYAETFSEWSVMSLIKCIDTPYLNLMNGQIKLSQTNRVSDMSDIIGYLQWENKDASEYLYSYRFRVYDAEDIADKNKKDFDTIFSTIPPLEDSGELRPHKASPNRLNYLFKTDFKDIKRYRIYVTYETDNQYTKTEYFTFYIQNFISSSNLLASDAKLVTAVDKEKQGVDVLLTLKKNYLNVPSKYLVFRRSSSETDFRLWDDIHTVKLTSDNIVEILNEEKLQYSWTDWTVKDGVFYKYCVQEVDLVDNRAEKIIATNYEDIYQYYKSLFSNEEAEIQEADTILNLKDSFFINKNNSLKFSLDTVVSSVTKNRKDTITETLNSKYPFIYRSGKIEYDSYNIEGTISIQGDMYTLFNTIDIKDSLSSIIADSRVKLHGLDNIFMNKQALLKYEDVFQMYQNYEEKYNLNYQNDFTVERLFREKVEEFLTDGNPKLFKNATFGNKIILLTDVSLSPKENTNNMIYTFSATMTEIDDDNVDNYAFYNIINLNKWIQETKTSNSVTDTIDNNIGQYSYYPNEEGNIVDIFAKLTEKYHAQTGNFTRNVYDIYKIKIDLSEILIPLDSTKDVLGKAVINGKEFYISKNYPYLTLDNVDIKSLTLEVNQNNQDKVVIDYLTKIITQLIYSTDGWVSISEKQIGQIYKEYTKDSQRNVYKDIYDKYYNKNVMFEKRMVGINKLLIQAYYDKDNLIPLSNVNFLIKDKKTNIDTDDVAYLHATDRNGVIDLYDEGERNILQILFEGVQVKENIDTKNINKNEYSKINPTIYPTEQSLFNMQETPEEHTLYQVSKLSLAFFYNDEQLNYDAQITGRSTVDIDIDSGSHTAADVSAAIYQQLQSGNADLAPTTEQDTDKYIYIDGQFYKLDDNNCIQLSVWLKITYLFEYLTKKKVSS